MRPPTQREIEIMQSFGLDKYDCDFCENCENDAPAWEFPIKGGSIAKCAVCIDAYCLEFTKAYERPCTT